MGLDIYCECGLCFAARHGYPNQLSFTQWNRGRKVANSRHPDEGDISLSTVFPYAFLHVWVVVSAVHPASTCGGYHARQGSIKRTGQYALLAVIYPTTVHTTMATPQDPIQLNVFSPPRPYLVRISLKSRRTARTHEVHGQNDDSVFPQGTLVTKSDDDDLQTIFIKQEGGSYIVEASTDPDLVMCSEPFEVRPHLNSHKRNNLAYGDRARLRTSILGPSRRFSTPSLAR